MAEQCPWCGAVVGELLAHMLEAHAPTKQHNSTTHTSPSTAPPVADHTCTICAKGYKSKKSLLRHLKEAHSKANERFECKECQSEFKTKRTLLKHVKKFHKSEKGKCDHCSKQYRRQGELKAHMRRCKGKPQFTCRKCKAAFPTLQHLTKHQRVEGHAHLTKFKCHACKKNYVTRTACLYHKNICRTRKARLLQMRKSLPPIQEPRWESKTAIDGDARVHTLYITDEYDLQLCLLQNKRHIYELLLADLKDLRRVKWYLVAHVQVKSSDGGDAGIRYLRCPNKSLLREDEVEEQLRQGITHTLTNFDSNQGEGSNILFEKVDKIELMVAKLSLLKGSSYLELPKKFRNGKKGLINIKNSDNKCFLYSVLAGLDRPRTNPQRVSAYRGRVKEVNMKGIKYPVKVKDVSKVESNNPFLSISVFGLEDEEVVPMYISKELKRAKHVNLLLIQKFEESHYVLISNFSYFMSHLTKQKRALLWCENCLTPRHTVQRHMKHVASCMEHNAQAIRMPTKFNSTMKFTDYEKQLHHDYVIYCDLECVLQPYATALPDPSKSSTTRQSQHVPSGYCYVIVGPDGKLVKPPTLKHGGNRIVKSLLSSLKSEEMFIKNLRGEPFPIDMTEETEKAFQEATQCYLCLEPLPRERVVKVRDHDHTKEFDNYRGASCRGCNLNLKMSDFIPVFFHNLSGYDGHLIMSEIGSMSDGSNLSAIPKTKEKYISFSWGRLRFLDSFNFLSSSLEKLVKDLKPEEMEILSVMFPDQEKRALVSRKGVYPYCYFDCEEKFEEEQLPAKEFFKSDLSNKDISDDDYAHALNVYKVFNMANLWDYHDLYLMSDVLLLADVMETYRKVTMSHFKLDVVHYYTTPGFSWSAALLYTKQHLQLVECLDDHLMWEKGMRGGVATINCRAAYANNSYVPETYDEGKEKSYLLYVDANNLYGAAMSRALPVGSFRQLCQSEIDELDILSINATDAEGFLFEVDLDYPDNLHDAHNDFCLAPEHFAPQYSDVSPLQKEMQEELNLSQNAALKKLIPNLKNKRNYVVYGTTLKLYLQLGLILKKVHQVITFEQKPWLAPYIQHNTEMRKKATSDFQKNLWKLKNNAVYGKTCEQTRKRRNIAFTKEKIKFRKLVASPLFHSFDIFDHGMVAVERRKAKVFLNRPMYTGQVVLDISKEIMFDFHFNCMKKRYGDKITVCASDTDSLIYKVVTDDVYKDMAEMQEWFDTSDYPTTHPLYSIKNKKVLGKFKDELNGTAMKSFIGLRPKMYSFKRADATGKCVGKGIPRPALSRLDFEDYEACLQTRVPKQVTFSKISTDRKHHLFTTYSSKKGLSCYDDKRYILENNVNTLAYGHFSLRDEGAENLEQLVEMMNEDLEYE